MKTRTLLMYVAAWVLMVVGCRKEAKPEGDGQISTFRQERTTTKSAAATTGSQTTVSTTAIDLLKQRVATGTSERVLQRKAYTTSYNKRRRTPNWVAWTLTKDHTYGRLLRDNERFEEDMDVAEPRATFQDYYNSRYDRGHMCPAGDNKWDQEALTESFLMTNICPQSHQLNTNDWNDLEQRCRNWAKKYGRIYIVCGPVLRGDKHKTIGKRKNRITVPEAFYKVVLRAGRDTTAIGFVYENNDERQPVCTVDEVERLTGLDFFHHLPDAVESRVEQSARFDAW